MDPIGTTNFLQDKGLLGALVMFIFAAGIGLYKEWWVPGPFYRDVKKERDDLRETNKSYEAHFKIMTDTQVAQGGHIADLRQIVLDKTERLAALLADRDEHAPPRRRQT